MFHPPADLLPYCRITDHEIDMGGNLADNKRFFYILVHPALSAAATY